MTHRILTPLKTFFLSLSMKACSKQTFKASEELFPKARKRELNEIAAGVETDAWLFDAPHNAIEAEVNALSSTMNSTAGALGSLRELLSSIAAHAPIVDAPFANAPVNAVWHEDALFDGEPMAAMPIDVLEDADLFMDVEPAPAQPAVFSQAA